MLQALIAELASIEDPRCAWKVEHRLLDILVVAVCAVLGEAETFEDIALYGRCKEAWLRGFLALPNGIPSHDTFRRVFTLIDPDAFERCFLGWVRAVFRPGEDAGSTHEVRLDQPGHVGIIPRGLLALAPQAGGAGGIGAGGGEGDPAQAGGGAA